MPDPGELVLILAGIGLVYFLMTSPTVPADDGGNVANSGGGGSVDLTAKVQQFSQAIAHAEGFGIPGKVPTTHHNPGDLGPGDCPGYSQATLTDGSYVCQLPDDQTGWNFLYAKIQNAFLGNSAVYSPEMTVTQWAQVYAGNWQAWAANVAAVLEISPDTPIVDWLNS